MLESGSAAAVAAGSDPGLPLAGVVTPLLTPFEDDGGIARDLWVTHAYWVLAEGAHALSPFGTTGEAQSVGIAARRQALDWLVEAGMPPARLVPGTGMCALEDAVALSAHAVGLGCGAVMVLPPFFYKGASDDGLFAFYARLIERVGDGLRLVLYHIPSHTGVPVSPGLARRLAAAFPGVVVGYKDSGGDFAHTEAVIAAAPTLSVFPGSEAFLVRGMAAGAAGCISATCNVNAAAIRALYEACRAEEAIAPLEARVVAFRRSMEEAGLIPGMKALLAERLGEPGWGRVLPPLLPPEEGLGARLAAAFGDRVAHISRAA
ncbi:MAG: dihydrodipicolinate synthase family protein [Paracoccaceae bacterium]